MNALYEQDATSDRIASIMLSQPQHEYYPRLLSLEDVADTTAAADADLENDAGSSSIHVFSAVMSNILLFFLIFGLSATVEMKNLKQQLTNKYAIACGVAMQFLIMPLLGFLAVMALTDHGLTQAMGMTLLVVTASPGGSYSNWWCSTFNAELALSVAMTTVSSILSIALLPANLFLYTFLAYGTEDVLGALNFGTLFISLGIVMGAIGSGLYAGHRWDSPQFHVYANRFGSVCGLLLILFSIFLSSSGGDSSFFNLDWAFYVGVAFPCLVGISLANIIGRSLHLTKPETVAISIECCYQNTGIATSIAITMFPDKEERAQAVAVPLFYGLVEAVVICIYCIWAWKMGWTKAPADENVCVVITKTYEVEEEQEQDVYLEDDEPSTSTHFEDEPDAEAGVIVTGITSSGAEAVAVQEPHRRPHQGVQTVGTGFWTRVFPPVLVRKLSSFSFRWSSEDKDHPRDSEDQDSEADDFFFELPEKFNNKTDVPRNRLNTAETAASSTASPSTPLSPDGSPRETMIGTMDVTTDVMASLAIPSSIPEVPSPPRSSHESDTSDKEESSLKMTPPSTKGGEVDDDSP